MKKINWVKWLSIVFFLIPMLFILLFPFIVMISTSFKTLREVSQIPPTFIPQRADAGELPGGLEHHPAGQALPQQPLPGRSARWRSCSSWASRQPTRCAVSGSPAAART